MGVSYNNSEFRKVRHISTSNSLYFDNYGCVTYSYTTRYTYGQDEQIFNFYYVVQHKII